MEQGPTSKSDGAEGAGGAVRAVRAILLSLLLAVDGGGVRGLRIERGNTRFDR